MEKERLKLELLEKIINCDDASVLKRVEEILLDYSSKASEAGEEYTFNKRAALSEELNISPEQEEELMRRYDDHLKNGGKSIPWEVVKQNLNESSEF